MFNPRQPYNSLPQLPPQTEIETKTILKSCIEARSALSELKIAGRLLPNQSVLINLIPLLEAKASSEIENIVTTTDRLFIHSENTNANLDPATKETLRYRTALKAGFQLLKTKPLSTAIAIQICSVIKDCEMQIRKVPGTTLGNEATGETIYTPPQGIDTLNQLMTNWERFLNLPSEIDPLIVMAVAHYQFEAIHPFSDGNGRTGRILNILYLIQCGLLDTPILYLSRFITRNKSNYYDLLLNVTKTGNWEDWVSYMLLAVTDTCKWTTSKIESISALATEIGDKVKKEEPTIYSQELIDTIFTQPYCRIINLVDNGIVKRQSASVYLKKLCELGILEEIKEGREKIFVNQAMIRQLTMEQ